MNLRWTAAVIVWATIASAADWNQFRGPNRDGISPETTAPLIWGQEKNIKWKIALPQPGNSSPIVSGDRVFVNCAQDAQGIRRSLYCFGRADGRQLWVRTISYEKNDPAHAQNPYCAPTPAADGQRVIVWHGSAGVHCYDYDGKQLWSRDLGVIRHIWGYASSPVIWGDAVFLNCGPGERTFIIALDKKTGTTLWEQDEPGGADDQSKLTKSWIGSWSTPVPAKVDGADQLILGLPRHVMAYEPHSGKILWSCGGLGDLAYGDVLIHGEIGVALSGYGGPAVGFTPGGEGDMTATRQLWRDVAKNPQRVGSGVLIGGNVYIASEPYISCIEAATGKERWRSRQQGQTFWGSVVAVGDRLYVTSQRGVTIVFAADPKQFRLLAANDLAEQSNSTPAVSQGEIFIRTFGHLFCVGEASK